MKFFGTEIYIGKYLKMDTVQRFLDKFGIVSKVSGFDQTKVSLDGDVQKHLTFWENEISEYSNELVYSLKTRMINQLRGTKQLTKSQKEVVRELLELKDRPIRCKYCGVMSDPLTHRIVHRIDCKRLK